MTALHTFVPKRLFAPLLIGLCVLLFGEVQGQYSVYYASYQDSERNREVKADVFYPATGLGANAPLRDGPYPVVIVAHAMGVPVYFYSYLVRKFCNEGFVVVLPKTEMSLSADFRAFAKDIAFLPDALLADSQNSESPIYGGIEDSFGLIGHSMGGSCSILAAAWSKRFKALVALAPPEWEPSPAAAAAQLDIPTLIITGGSDGVTTLQEHVLPIYQSVGSDCKKLMVIHGGTHCGFSSHFWLCEMGETILASVKEPIPRKEQHDVVKKYAMYWMRAHLLSDCEAMPAMHNKALADDRIVYTNECQSQTSPCLIEDGNHLMVEPFPSLNAVRWTINNEPVYREMLPKISTDYGSGVYQAILTLSNGCELTTEEWWLHRNGTTAKMGEPRFRLFQGTDEHWHAELFGAAFPSELIFFDTSGKQLLRQELKGHLTEVSLPQGYSGLMHYAVSHRFKTLVRGKLLISPPEVVQQP